MLTVCFDTRGCGASEQHDLVCFSWDIVTDLRRHTATLRHLYMAKSNRTKSKLFLPYSEGQHEIGSTHFAVSHHLHFNAKCSGSFNGCGDVVETCNLGPHVKHEVELGTEADVKQ